jgi:hypothetical protein
VDALHAQVTGARAKIGNITFANSDTAWDAYAHAAMAEGVRAVGELLGLDTVVEGRKPWYTRFLKRLSKN